MAEEMVKVGCKLPQGMVLEVGYSVVARDKDGGKSISLQQHDDYMRVRIKGWTHVDGSKQAYHSGLLLPPWLITASCRPRKLEAQFIAR